jgi:CheY-like chemotaxis protein
VIAPQDLDLDEVVGGMLELIRRALGEVVTVQWRPGHAVGNVRADRVQIEQVLMNLCLNGRDAMPEGGELVLETENVDLDADACRHHAWARPGRYVRLSVTDSGEGIAPEVAGRIWEPFFTTKEPGKGTGLGLATVYGIVQQHEGLVNVASEPGRGTRLEVYLPQVARSAAMAGPRGPVRPRGGHETVLVAEDNGNVRALMRAVLERAGYEVLVAEDGRRALDLLAEHGERVDLALLDVVMPGLGGREVRDQGRRRWPHLRYLFASGYSLDGVHTDFVLDPDVALIQKPFAAADLLAAVRAQLDGDGAPG